jgi:hypothetical protein
VDWTTLVATALGAVIATGTSMLADRRKDRHDTQVEWRTVRRQLYGDFLEALSKARSDLITLAQANPDPDAEDITEAARVAFAPCYHSRQLLEALAPDEVLEHALTYFRAVRDIRKLIQRGGRNGHPEWAGALKAATDTLDALYVAIRADLRPA